MDGMLIFLLLFLPVLHCVLMMDAHLAGPVVMTTIIGLRIDVLDDVQGAVADPSRHLLLLSNGSSIDRCGVINK